MGNNFSVTHPLPIYRSTDLPDRGLLATTLVATSIVCSNPVGPPSNFKLNCKLDYVLQIRSDFAHEHLLHVQEHARHPAAALQVDPDSLVSQRRASGDVYSPLLKKNASSELEIKGLPRPIENAVI